MKKNKIVLSCLIIFSLFFSIFAVCVVLILIRLSGIGEKLGEDKIGVVRIEGVIVAGKSKPEFFSSGFVGSESVIEKLKNLRENPSVKAIVLRVNSPGGSAAGSQEIYQEIKNCRKEGKKIVVSMSDICTSGCYYISSSADVIVANPGTLTGSIGVILQVENLKELFEKIGIGFEVIKSGEYKDIGSPWRKISKKERELLQNLIDNIYRQFVKDVASGRNLNIKEVEKIADGRVFTGEQALKYKLVDKIGNFPYAIKVAANLAKITGKPKILEYKSGGFMSWYEENSLMRLLSKILCIDEYFRKNIEEFFLSGKR
jgi:protease-4